MRLRRHITLLAVCLATFAALAGTAAAADHTGSVSASAPFKWHGGPLTGTFSTTDVYGNIPCDAPGNDCDDTLINVSVPSGSTAQATVSITGPDGNDLDLFVYQSDASGTVGDGVSSSAGSTADETTTFDVAPGYYLIRVVAATATAAEYDGDAKVVARPAPGEVNYGVDPADPNAGSGGGGGGRATSLANDLAPASIAKAPRFSQSRLLTGTAADKDGEVVYVDVGLVRIRARGCTVLRANGRFRPLRKCSAPPLLRAKGTSRWHLTLPSRLPKGTYVVFSRATDNLGRREAGLNKRNRVRFRIT